MTEKYSIEGKHLQYGKGFIMAFIESDDEYEIDITIRKVDTNK